MNQETAGLTIRPDCTAVLHPALRVLTALETTWRDPHTVHRGPGHLTTTPAVPDRRSVNLAPNAAHSRDHHRAPTHARHPTLRDVDSTTDSALALGPRLEMPVLATSGQALPAITKRRATLIPDASRSTTRKKKMPSIITILAMHHAEGQLVRTGRIWEDPTTKAKIMAGFPACAICPLVLIRNEPPRAPPLDLVS
jgi:hypothetical protein